MSTVGANVESRAGVESMGGSSQSFFGLNSIMKRSMKLFFVSDVVLCRMQIKLCTERAAEGVLLSRKVCEGGRISGRGVVEEGMGTRLGGRGGRGAR